MFAYCGNNPVNYCDSAGYCAVTIVSENADLSVVGGIVLLPIYLRISETIEDTKNHVSMKLSEYTSDKRYTVYFLYATGQDENTIVYVGRVLTDNFKSRMIYHSNKGRSLAFAIDGLDYPLCRAIEQGGMIYNHTINRGNDLYNQIRGISPQNRNRYTYLAAVFDILGREMYPDNGYLPISYWANFSENEFLNLGM